MYLRACAAYAAIHRVDHRSAVVDKLRIADNCSSDACT
jgi:hypothetical protein